MDSAQKDTKLEAIHGKDCAFPVRALVIYLLFWDMVCALSVSVRGSQVVINADAGGRRQLARDVGRGAGNLRATSLQLDGGAGQTRAGDLQLAREA